MVSLFLGPEGVLQVHADRLRSPTADLYIVITVIFFYFPFFIIPSCFFFSFFARFSCLFSFFSIFFFVSLSRAGNCVQAWPQIAQRLLYTWDYYAASLCARLTKRGEEAILDLPLVSRATCSGFDCPFTSRRSTLASGYIKQQSLYYTVRERI